MNTTKIVFLAACACSMMMVGCGQQKSEPKNGQMPGDTTGRDTIMNQDTSEKGSMGNGSYDTAKQMPKSKKRAQ